MTATLFKLYEARRFKYKPGARWKDTGFCTIKELEIASPKEVSTHSHPIHSFFDDYDGARVYFKVLKLSGGSSFFHIGQIVSWPTSYMERNYEVII